MVDNESKEDIPILKELFKYIWEKYAIKIIYYAIGLIGFIYVYVIFMKEKLNVGTFYSIIFLLLFINIVIRYISQKFLTNKGKEELFKKVSNISDIISLVLISIFVIYFCVEYFLLGCTLEIFLHWLFHIGLIIVIIISWILYIVLKRKYTQTIGEKNEYHKLYSEIIEELTDNEEELNLNKDINEELQ